MTSQPAMTTTIVMKAVSSTSHTERPSMPSEYSMPRLSIQGLRSTNCSAAVVRSKPV